MKKISIIIPCRNEEKYISKCIDSILSSDYPKDKTEIFIIDGESDDKTRDIIERYSRNSDSIFLLNNPKRIVPTALNIGIKKATGDYIIRLDAHSIYNPDYFTKLVHYAEKLNADNVGGVVLNRPINNSAAAIAISKAMGSSYGVGNSYFRIGTSEVKKVDTVPFGCFKKEIFNKIGLFDEDMVRNQDDEFNARIIKNGGSIYLIPEIEIIYYTRDSYSKLYNMFYQYGLFKPLGNKKIGYAYSLRQFVPLVFVVALLLSPLYLFFMPLFFLYIFALSLYFLLGIYIGFSSIKTIREIKYAFLLPYVFFLMHFSYGLGYLKGWFFVTILKKETMQVHINR